MDNYLASNLFFDQLVVEGTSVIFGKLCTGKLSLTHALAQHTAIRYAPALHEGVAISMAMGYSRASGKPGVAHVFGLPGITNSLSAISNAAQSRVPLIVIAEQDDLHIKAPCPNLCNLAAPFCKWTCEVQESDELAHITRQAFHEAQSPPRAPVLLWIPKSTMRQATSKPVIVPPKFSPPGAANSAFLKQAAQLLISARKAVVIVGNEVSQYRARKEAISLVEVLGCPAFSEALPCGLNFPNQHPLFAGLLPEIKDDSLSVLADCDVILAAGVQNQFPEGLIPATSVVIQINVDLSGYLWPCHFSASADLAESLSKLRAELQLLVDNQWVANAKARAGNSASWIKTRRKTLELDVSTHLEDATSIPARVLLRLLDSLRPTKSLIVNDMSNHALLPLQAMKFESSASYFATNNNSPGCGLSEALGIQWTSPTYTVICLTNDSSLLCQPQALWTASNCNLGVKTIVFNYQNYRPVKASALELGSHATEPDKPPVCLMELAHSMNVPANSISAVSEVERALTELIETPGPGLLDVHIE